MTTNILAVVGAGGMGELIARRQGAGAHVLLADFSEDTLTRVADEMRSDGFTVSTFSVDVSSAASVGALVQHAVSLGPVTHVVHTAGLSPAQAPRDAILAVDLAGVAFVLDAFGQVVESGGSGVVIASMAGTMAAGRFPAEVEDALRTTPSERLLALPFLGEDVLPTAGAAYGVAKRANQLRVQAASRTWGARGARVNSISPGVIATPMGQLELASDSGAYMRSLVEASGTGRLGTTTDIAAAAAFLLGPDASFITGTDLLVDGGAVAASLAGGVRPATAT